MIRPAHLYIGCTTIVHTKFSRYIEYMARYLGTRVSSVLECTRVYTPVVLISTAVAAVLYIEHSAIEHSAIGPIKPRHAAVACCWASLVSTDAESPSVSQSLARSGWNALARLVYSLHLTAAGVD